MLISTADSIPGHRIVEMKGIIHAVVQKAFSRDPEFVQLAEKKFSLLPWVKFISDDATAGYLIGKANDLLMHRAGELGANAVISVSYQFDVFWKIGVTAYGTAVIVENVEDETSAQTTPQS